MRYIANKICSLKKELINAPKSLRAIPKGNINEILHLSDIRRAWDDVYLELDRAISRNAIDSNGIKKKILDFASKSDTYIVKSLDEITKAEISLGRELTKPEIANITNKLKYLLE